MAHILCGDTWERGRANLGAPDYGRPILTL